MCMGTNLTDLFDDPNINGRIFYPRKIEKPAGTIENIEFVDLKITPEISIGSVLYHLDKKLPTVILFHGNGEIATDYSYGVKNFFACKVNLMVVDFRVYGFSTGQPTYTYLIEDSVPSFKLAIEWLKTHGYRSSYFLMGRSLGSACAAEIAAQNPNEMMGVIFESGFADTLKLMQSLFMLQLPGITQKTIEPWSNIPRIKQIGIPTLIIHGDRDLIVPLEQGELIYANLPAGTPKNMVIIEGAGHNDIQSYGRPYFEALSVFIQTNI